MLLMMMIACMYTSRWKLLLTFHGGDPMSIAIQVDCLTITTLLLLQRALAVSTVVKTLSAYHSFALNTVLMITGHTWKAIKYLFSMFLTEMLLQLEL